MQADQNDTAPVGAVSNTRSIRVVEGKEQNAIRIARARKQSARVPQGPGLEGGPRSGIHDPRSPALSGGTCGKRRPAQCAGRWCWSSGPGCRTGIRAPRRVPRKKRSMPPAGSRPVDPLDDDDYPAYTMGRAAEMLGTTPAFLRAPR